MGSSTREYVGFLMVVMGNGSLFSPSAALSAQLLPHFFPSFVSAADPSEEESATTNM